MSQTDAATTAPRSRRKTLLGVVVSSRMDKTIVVQVERVTHHERYHKVLRVRKKFYAHDQDNTAQVGDRVEIMSTRPMSRLKRWRLVQVIDKAKAR